MSTEYRGKSDCRQYDITVGRRLPRELIVGDGRGPDVLNGVALDVTTRESSMRRPAELQRG
jgi:hypothetical protein